MVDCAIRASALATPTTNIAAIFVQIERVLQIYLRHFHKVWGTVHKNVFAVVEKLALTLAVIFATCSNCPIRLLAAALRKAGSFGAKVATFFPNPLVVRGGPRFAGAAL